MSGYHPNKQTELTNWYSIARTDTQHRTVSQNTVWLKIAQHSPPPTFSLAHLSMGRVRNPPGVYVTLRAYTYTPGGLPNPWGVYVHHAGCTYTRGGSGYIFVVINIGIIESCSIVCLFVCLSTRISGPQLRD